MKLGVMIKSRKSTCGLCAVYNVVVKITVKVKVKAKMRVKGEMMT